MVEQPVLDDLPALDGELLDEPGRFAGGDVGDPHARGDAVAVGDGVVHGDRGDVEVVGQDLGQGEEFVLAAIGPPEGQEQRFDDVDVVGQVGEDCLDVALVRRGEHGLDDRAVPLGE